MTVWRCMLWAVRIVALVAVTGAAITAIVYIPAWSPKPPASPEAAFTRAEFITIVLTAVTVVLGALAIVLALASVIGYVQIKNAAEATAKAAAEATAKATAEAIAAVRAEEVAARVAESMTTKIAGRDAAAGDDFAQAAGGENADGG